MSNDSAPVTPLAAVDASGGTTDTDAELRRLVTVETVRDVHPIPDADAIEAVTVRGWTVVTRKGEFVAGDPCLYIEIDACLPLDDPRFAFLTPRGSKTLPDGREVHRVKTAKLRGTYSQGIVFPLAASLRLWRPTPRRRSAS